MVTTICAVLVLCVSCVGQSASDSVNSLSRSSWNLSALGPCDNCTCPDCQCSGNECAAIAQPIAWNLGLLSAYSSAPTSLAAWNLSLLGPIPSTPKGVKRVEVIEPKEEEPQGHYELRHRYVKRCGPYGCETFDEPYYVWVPR